MATTTDTQAHFEFVWPPPRTDADGNSWNSKTATSYPCGGFTSASTNRTLFPLSGSVPIQLRLANWNSPDSPRLVYLNIKLNLGNNAGVGVFSAPSASSSTAGTNSTANHDPNAPLQQVAGQANPDFAFSTGLRRVQETFFMGGEVCLQDIWAPGWEGHTDLTSLPIIGEGTNGTLNIEVAETGTFGEKDIIRRGYMCADITFTEIPLSHHQYTKNCHNDSIIVPTNTQFDFPDEGSSTITFPLTPLAPISPPLAPHHLSHPGYMGGPWSWHGSSSMSESSDNVAARVGAAIAGSIAAVFVFLIFFGLWRRKIYKRNQQQRESAYENSDVVIAPVYREPMPRQPAGAHLRGGFGGFEEAERRRKEEGSSFAEAGAVEEGLPSYAEAAGKGREVGREKM